MKVGDHVTVTFPAEPAVPDAGRTVDCVIVRLRDDPTFASFPVVVGWASGWYNRCVKLEWIHGVKAAAKQPMRRRSTT